MYWQVYLHKTGIVAEQLLIRVLRRARELRAKKVELQASDALLYFLNTSVKKDTISHDILLKFAALDDIDILAALKKWQHHDDFILASLSKMILHRELLQVKIKKNPIPPQRILKQLKECAGKYDLTTEEARYFVFAGTIANTAYNKDEENINILMGNAKIIDVAKASDHLNLKALSKTVTKYYICYPKKSVS
jgi:HD superfamily phosphohydrolase